MAGRRPDFGSKSDACEVIGNELRSGAAVVLEFRIGGDGFDLQECEQTVKTMIEILIDVG